MIFMIGYRSSQWWNQPHNDKKTISVMSLSTLLLFILLPLIYFFSFPSSPALNKDDYNKGIRLVIWAWKWFLAP